eukprot:PITA_14534
MSHLIQVLETLMKHQLLANLKKREFAQQSLAYLGYVIGGGDLEIDPSKMEAIMKWSMPTNVYEVKSFIGATQYLRKSLASFSVVETPLHAITISDKSLQWGKVQHRDFEELKKKSSQTPVLELPNLQRPFKWRYMRVENLKFYEPSMLDQEEEQVLPSMENLAPDAQAELTKDTILWKRSKTTRQGQHDLWQIGLKGQLPGKAKWYTKEKVEEKCPHLI